MNDIKIDLPGYRITRLIGKGGFAKVYLAIQESLDRTVALKIMEPRMADESEFCERFLKEGKIVAQLSNHPNIVTIYDVGKHQDLYFMAMEYVADGTLRDKIKDSSKPIDIPAVIEQIAGALSYAHKKDFIHRDVKPANILFSENGIAMLTDFGIAKSVNSGATRLTEAGFTVGTPEYMSPEQTLAKQMDGRTDLYSFGIVIYEMLMREKPFIGDDAFATALQHINEPPPKLSDEFSHYQGLLDRLLAKEPEARFDDADALIRYLKGGDVSMSATVKDSQAPELTSRPTVAPAAAPTLVVDVSDKPPLTLESNLSVANAKPRSSPLIFGSGTLILIAISVAVWWIFRDSPQPQSPAPAEATTTGARPDASPDFGLTPAKDKVERLLNVAKAHEEMGRLSEPPGSNACDAYSLVLEIEPENHFAQGAIRRIGCKLE